ncbi:cholesterol 7-desaturase nvd-like isoform X1 [Dermacentor silvarum]|uniref:cholesterol 7-desaturase nvd-like isoform X1 n=1 Tax=Dermacentor silvarum TaxID=543639 RepID=UPI0021015792|nr:cholesterol 7-desaturase nvd-like isoform X1 [Dermacentor silvarum]
MGEETSSEQCVRLHPLTLSGYQVAENGSVLVAVFAVVACSILWALRYFKGSSNNHEQKRRPRMAMPEGMPPVFPNGWIPVIEASQVKKGELKSLSAMGKELVAFRTEDGEARIFDAYCPHMGANLGVMGRILDNCIVCPFHGWRFDADTGACTHVPYATKVPSFVTAKAWTCKELLGMVFIWYHADGEKPSWEIPADVLGENVESEASGQFEHRVHTHIQDIAENGADMGHFTQLHVASALVDGVHFKKTMGETWKGRILQHQWATNWSPFKHEATVAIDSYVTFLGWKSKYLCYNIEARQVGPALVIIRVHGYRTNVTLIQSLIPEGPFNIRMLHKLHFEPRMSWLVRWIWIIMLRNMVDRDGIVWNSKAFLKKPMLVKEEQSVASFRKWYSQFYSASSPTWQEIRDLTLEW